MSIMRTPGTSGTVAGSSALQTLDPANVRLRFSKRYRMAFLQDFVGCDEGFEGLDFVGEDGLAGKDVRSCSR